MSAWRWGCEDCGSVTLQYLTRQKTALCKSCGHISDTVKDRNTGGKVLVSERKTKNGIVELGHKPSSTTKLQ